MGKQSTLWQVYKSEFPNWYFQGESDEADFGLKEKAEKQKRYITARS